MRITCVIHSLSGGGAERVMAGLASALASRGHQVHLITLDDGKQDRHTLLESVTRHCLNQMAPSRSWADRIANTATRLRSLRAAIRQSQPQVVLSFCDVSNVMTLAATRGLGLSVVVSERSDPAQQRLPQPWSLLRPRLYARAQAVVVLTKTAQQHVASWGCQSVVIPSAIDIPAEVQASIAERAQAKPQGSQSRRLLAVGRLEQEKGFDRLVAAFAEQADRFPEWQLRLIGDGTQRSALEQQIAALGLSQRVALTGWLRPVWPEYIAADLFVLPSRYEGFPSALLEAMACGVAVLAVDCESGPREIIQHGCNGWLVANEDKALSSGLGHLMSDAALRAQLSAQAMEICQRFSWSRMVDDYEQVLRDAAR